MKKLAALLSSIVLAGGGGATSTGGVLASPGALPAAAASARRCSTMAVARMLSGSADTKVILARSFAKGDRLPMPGAEDQRAVADLCLVKLLVGPGTPGPVGAPSTQSGIGIEVWLPSPTAWNGRIHNVGGGGFVGQPEVIDPTQVVSSIGEGVAPSIIAGVEGAVSGYTDTGHRLPASGADGSFLMLPNGTVNSGQWRDFSERGIHQLAVKTKELAASYYGRSADRSYFEGCSTGGRQAHKEAQMFPDDYDGIVGGAPAMHWTRFITSELYPQLVMQRDLDGPMSPAKLLRVSSAAVSACDVSGGRHMGYILDPKSCRYDATKDKTLLCSADGGRDATAACLTRREALAVNKMWYGQTADGTVPDPAVANGFTTDLTKGYEWFGIPRGTQQMLAQSEAGQPTPFPIATHMIALISGRSVLADPTFHNATGDGSNGWKALTYPQLAAIADKGDQRQATFSHVNADSPDLTRFEKRGGKFLAYHGLADQVIPPQGTMRYYEALSRRAGGVAATRAFYRMLTVPGMGHCQGGGSVDGLKGVSPPADPPLPARGQFYTALVNWVEKGQAPDALVFSNTQGEAHPVCEFPKTLHFVGGDTKKATSYRCS